MNFKNFLSAINFSLPVLISCTPIIPIESARLTKEYSFGLSTSTQKADLFIVEENEWGRDTFNQFYGGNHSFSFLLKYPLVIKNTVEMSGYIFPGIFVNIWDFRVKYKLFDCLRSNSQGIASSVMTYSNGCFNLASRSADANAAIGIPLSLYSTLGKQDIEIIFLPSANYNYYDFFLGYKILKRKTIDATIGLRYCPGFLSNYIFSFGATYKKSLSDKLFLDSSDFTHYELVRFSMQPWIWQFSIEKKLHFTKNKGVERNK
jgi:hypothetical protein